VKAKVKGKTNENKKYSKYAQSIKFIVGRHFFGSCVGL